MTSTYSKHKTIFVTHQSKKKSQDVTLGQFLMTLLGYAQSRSIHTMGQSHPIVSAGVTAFGLVTA